MNPAPLLLQTSGMCPNGGDMVEYFRDFQFVKGIVCQYADPMGLLVIGLIMWGGIGLSLYMRTGSALIPFVVTLAIGGAVLSQMASIGVAFVTILVLGVGAGSIMVIYRRLT